MKSKTCDHPPPAEIHETQLSISHICPPCLIERYINDAQEIQKGIERRGGIFASKRDPTSNPDSFNHSAYIKVWRTFKLQCSRDIDALEDLQVEFPELAEEWNVKSALDRWNNACNEWSRVPGCSYVEIEKEEQNHAADSSESPASTNEDTSAAQPSNSGSTHDISENISAQLKQHLNLWNILPYAPQEYEPSPSPSNTPTTTLSKSQTPLPLRSALKGTRPTPLTTRPTFSSTSTTITHRSFPPITEPHNRHTAAEFARPNLQFQRTSSVYQPAIWSSREGYTKLDTSGSKLSWYTYDKEHKLGAFAEREREENDGGTAVELRPVKRKMGAKDGEKGEGLIVGVGEPESER
jgi:hypothetical protein